MNVNILIDFCPVFLSNIMYDFLSAHLQPGSQEEAWPSEQREKCLGRTGEGTGKMLWKV